MYDPHDHWRDKAVRLLTAVASHYVPETTPLEELDDVLGLLAASPALRAEVGRVLEVKWNGRSPVFDEFLFAMERAQRYDGAFYRELMQLISRRRLDRDGIKTKAFELLCELTPP